MATTMTTFLKIKFLIRILHRNKSPLIRQRKNKNIFMM